MTSGKNSDKCDPGERTAVISREKELYGIIQSIRKKVDGWSSGGERADINVINCPEGIEITVKLYK